MSEALASNMPILGDQNVASIDSSRRYPPIFLNYRQKDGWAAIALDMALSEYFYEDNIFRATRSLRAGDNYTKILLEAAAGARVLVVCVSREWTKGLQEEVDHCPHKQPWVIREIRAAQAQKVPILPLRLDNAPPLREQGMPEGIDPSLADIAGLSCLNRDFEASVYSLARAISHLVPELQAVRLH